MTPDKEDETIIFPEEEEPLIVYVPADVIVNVEPVIEYPLAEDASVIYPFENVRVVSKFLKFFDWIENVNKDRKNWILNRINIGF